MAKGGGHEAPKSSGGGGGGHSAEKAIKALESAFDFSEWTAHVGAPAVGAGLAILKGLNMTTGYIMGLAYALGFSFVKEMIKGALH